MAPLENPEHVRPSLSSFLLQTNTSYRKTATVREARYGLPSLARALPLVAKMQSSEEIVSFKILHEAVIYPLSWSGLLGLGRSKPQPC